MEAGTGSGAAPFWRSLYEAAVLELDTEKMTQRIAAAETAIMRRIKELDLGSNTGEPEELMNALTVLRDLRKITADGAHDGNAD